MKAVSIVSLVPIRLENSDKSEMVSQLLFGEVADILETKDNWVKVCTIYDEYKGWVDAKQIFCISDENFIQRKTKIVTEPFLFYKGMLLSIGSEIENKNIYNNNDFVNIRENIANTALKFINVPYLWGGRSFFGIDCSGFTQIVYKVNGIKIPRDAHQQSEKGFVLDFLEEAKEGDLAFFENQEGKIVHTGIVLKNQKIVHAHGKVRVDNLDAIGIFNKDERKYTHKLRFIKKIID